MPPRKTEYPDGMQGNNRETHQETHQDEIKQAAARWAQEVSTRLGERIATRRRELGLSQERLARKYGCSRELIASIERGRARINVGDLPRLASLLSVSVLYFLASFDVYDYSGNSNAFSEHGQVFSHFSPPSHRSDDDDFMPHYLSLPPHMQATLRALVRDLHVAFSSTPLP